MAADTITISHETLTQFIQAILESAGTPPDAAAITAASLVAANLRGGSIRTAFSWCWPT